MKTIAHFFKHNPEAQEAFQTSDDMIFYRKHDAISHTDNLKDKKVKSFDRDDEEVAQAIAEYEADAEGKLVDLKPESTEDGNPESTKDEKTSSALEEAAKQFDVELEKKEEVESAELKAESTEEVKVEAEEVIAPEKPKGKKK